MFFDIPVTVLFSPLVQVVFWKGATSEEAGTGETVIVMGTGVTWRVVNTVSVIMLVTLQEIVDETVMSVACSAATNHSSTMMKGLHILMDASTKLGMVVLIVANECW